MVVGIYEGVFFLYGCFAVALSIYVAEHSGDAQDRAEVHQMLHLSDQTRGHLIVKGGVLWPLVFWWVFKMVVEIVRKRRSREK